MEEKALCYTVIVVEQLLLEKNKGEYTMKKKTMLLFLSTATIATIISGCGKSASDATEPIETSVMEQETEAMVETETEEAEPEYDVFGFNSYNELTPVDAMYIHVTDQTKQYSNYKTSDGTMISSEKEFEELYIPVNAKGTYKGKTFYLSLPEDDPNENLIGNLKFFAEDEIETKHEFTEKEPAQYITWEEIDEKPVYAMDIFSYFMSPNDTSGEMTPSSSGEQCQEIRVDAKGVYNDVVYYRVAVYGEVSDDSTLQVVKAEDVSEEKVEPKTEDERVAEENDEAWMESDPEYSNELTAEEEAALWNEMIEEAGLADVPVVEPEEGLADCWSSEEEAHAYLERPEFAQFRLH